MEEISFQEVMVDVKEVCVVEFLRPNKMKESCKLRVMLNKFPCERIMQLIVNLMYILVKQLQEMAKLQDTGTLFVVLFYNFER